MFSQYPPLVPFIPVRQDAPMSSRWMTYDADPAIQAVYVHPLFSDAFPHENLVELFIPSWYESEMLTWCSEYCTGRFYLVIYDFTVWEAGMRFELENDMVMFLLVFGEHIFSSGKVTIR